MFSLDYLTFSNYLHEVVKYLVASIAITNQYHNNYRDLTKNYHFSFLDSLIRYLELNILCEVFLEIRNSTLLLSSHLFVLSLDRKVLESKLSEEW